MCVFVQRNRQRTAHTLPNRLGHNRCDAERFRWHHIEYSVPVWDALKELLACETAVLSQYSPIEQEIRYGCGAPESSAASLAASYTYMGLHRLHVSFECAFCAERTIRARRSRKAIHSPGHGLSPTFRDSDFQSQSFALQDIREAVERRVTD